MSKEKTSEENSSEKNPSEENPSEENPSEENPVEENSSEKNPIEKNPIEEKLLSAIKNSLYGFVIGDAMGVPVEFKKRNYLKKNPVDSMTGCGTYPDIPAGTWSDDTSMTLATMDSLIKCNWNVNYNDIADRFCGWFYNAEYTATNNVFDIGNTTKIALYTYQNLGIDAIECGEKGENSNGNGSLMRMLPIALYCYYNHLNKSEILDIVKKSSSITHAHERSVMGCYIYVRYMICLLEGKGKLEAYDVVRHLDYSMFSEETNESYSRILKDDISKFNLDDIQSSGYVIHTLESVFWVILNNDSYEKSILTAVNLGEDTDTIGAITGSIAGLLYGYPNIPDEWLNALKNKSYLDKIISEFEHMLSTMQSKEMDTDENHLDLLTIRMYRFGQLKKKAVNK